MPPVASVLLVPARASAGVGDRVQFVVSAMDAYGDTLRGSPVNWTHTNRVVATLTDAGLATANAPGTDTIFATWDGLTGAATLVVDAPATPTVPSDPSGPSVPPTQPPPTQPPPTQPPPTQPPPTQPPPTQPPPASPSLPEPMPTGTIFWQDSFNGGLLGQLLTDAALLLPYNVVGPSFMHADADAGIGGSGALRIDWRRTSGCQDQSHLIERALPPTADIYAQFSVRYTPGFIFDWTDSGQSPCTGNAKKLFFFYPASGSGTSRFDFISENHTLGMGGDYDHPLFQQNASPMTVEQLGDGQWHRITIHVRQSSTPTTHDGFIYGWIDGVQRWAVTNWASGSSGGWQYFQLPSTFNQGSPVDQSEWLDDLTVWTP